MNNAQFERWSKTRANGFFQYVVLNSISILLVIISVRFMVYFISNEQASIQHFASTQSFVMGFTLLVLPFLFWGAWLIQESQYKKSVDKRELSEEEDRV
ncbi:hypothetical protein [Vibrio sp. YIC-376]|uniref:hypothetical protein n=1 Tax=Vibrio sp. YIC-376 TaxID=3136162 RepID=UPI00402A7987